MSWIGYMQLQGPDIIFQPSSVLPGAGTTARCDCSAGDTRVFSVSVGMYRRTSTPRTARSNNSHHWPHGNMNAAIPP